MAVELAVRPEALAGGGTLTCPPRSTAQPISVPAERRHLPLCRVRPAHQVLIADGFATSVIEKQAGTPSGGPACVSLKRWLRPGSQITPLCWDHWSRSQMIFRRLGSSTSSASKTRNHNFSGGPAIFPSVNTGRYVVSHHSGTSWRWIGRASSPHCACRRSNQHRSADGALAMYKTAAITRPMAEPAQYEEEGASVSSRVVMPDSIPAYRPPRSV